MLVPSGCVCWQGLPAGSSMSMFLSLKWEVRTEKCSLRKIFVSSLENAPHPLLNADGGCALAKSIECVLPFNEKLTLLLSSNISNCLECWPVTKVCSHIKKTSQIFVSTLETFPPILFSMGWRLRTGEKYRMCPFYKEVDPL